MSERKEEGCPTPVVEKTTVDPLRDDPRLSHGALDYHKPERHERWQVGRTIFGFFGGFLVFPGMVAWAFVGGGPLVGFPALALVLTMLILPPIRRRDAATRSFALGAAIGVGLFFLLIGLCWIGGLP